MTNELDLRKEYIRLRRELGVLLEKGRFNEGLSPDVIAQQNGFKSRDDIYRIEQGRERRLRRYFQLANYYGLNFHMAANYIDENYDKENFLIETDYSESNFFCWLGTILRRYHDLSSYSYKELSKLTDIPEERIIDIEKRKANCTIREACSLLICYGKALIPEVCRKDIL